MERNTTEKWEIEFFLLNFSRSFPLEEYQCLPGRPEHGLSEHLARVTRGPLNICLINVNDSVVM